MKLLRCLTILLFASAPAFGADLRTFSNADIDVTAELLTPTSFLTPGNYTSRQGYFTNFQITQWGNETLARGYLGYGNNLFAFEVPMRYIANNSFIGTGTFAVQYTNGFVCNFPIRINIDAFFEGLYISSENPANIPVVAPAGGGCFASGPTYSYRHQEPYVLN